MGYQHVRPWQQVAVCVVYPLALAGRAQVAGAGKIVVSARQVVVAAGATIQLVVRHMGEVVLLLLRVAEVTHFVGHARPLVLILLALLLFVSLLAPKRKLIGNLKGYGGQDTI